MKTFRNSDLKKSYQRVLMNDNGRNFKNVFSLSENLEICPVERN